MAAEHRAQGEQGELELLPWIHYDNTLIEIAVKSELLHIFVVAHLYKSFAGCVISVENILQNFQHLIGGTVLLVPDFQINLQIFFAGNLAAITAGLHHLLCAHAPTLGGKINTFTGALGYISSCIAHQGHPANDAPGAGMFRNGVGLHLDHLTIEQALFSPLADANLQALNQGLIFLHGACADGNMVILGENPCIKVWGNIGSHVHLGQIFIIFHLFRWQLDALLESDCHVVIAGIHCLGHPAIGAIGTND